CRLSRRWQSRAMNKLDHLTSMVSPNEGLGFQKKYAKSQTNEQILLGTSKAYTRKGTYLNYWGNID
ncbi:MAG: hypothetical protein ACKVJ1_09145, partial [Verrucomicrobiia bacterium]